MGLIDIIFGNWYRGKKIAVEINRLIDKYGTNNCLNNVVTGEDENSYEAAFDELRNIFHGPDSFFSKTIRYGGFLHYRNRKTYKDELLKRLFNKKN